MPRLDSFFQGSMPMQVGAVSGGGKGKKGKSKSTGDKGKGEGKGKDKNKHKGNDGDKNKERDDWNNGQRQAIFRATVHIARSGATNVRIVEIDWLNRKNGAVAGVQEPESEAEDAKRCRQ